MGSEWTESTVGSLCKNVTSGGTPRSSNESYYTDGTIPWLNTKEVNFQRIYRTEKNITQEGLDNSAAKWIPENSVIVAMYGATAGKVATNEIPLTTNQACCNLIIDDEKADHRFVYYHLSANTNTLLELANGAAQQNLNAGTIKSFPIPLPPLPEQKSIAHILGTLDDKIELNRRMNATLEGMAQALFKSWFVDFDPVIDNALAAGNPIPDELAPRAEVRKNALANGTTQQGSVDHPTLSDPRVLFPAAFEFTEELGWIPEGWKVKSLRDCSVEVESGKRPKGGVDKSLSDGVPSVGAESLLKIGEFAFSKLKYVTKDFAEKASKGWVQNYDVAIYKDGANVGDPTRVSMFGNGFPFEDFMVNEHVFLLRSSAIGQPFLYSLFKSEGLSRQLHSMGTSKAAQPGLNQKEVLSCAFVFSSDELCDAFNKRVYPLIGRRLQQGKESQTLTRLRDTLLPKLISGELRLPEAEQLTEEALT